MTKSLLNIKTNYELLSSLIKTQDLINYAINNNINVLGITDSKMFSFMEFYFLCIKNKIKPICGIDIECDKQKIILYAKNFNGYKNLCKIVTINNTNELKIEDIIKYKNDLICVVPYKSINKYTEYKKIFSLIFISFENDIEYNEVSKITKNILYMNEVLCFEEIEYKYLKYLYMIRDGKKATEENEYKINNKAVNFKNYEDATAEFIDEINLVLPDFEFKLPKYMDNSFLYLKELCKKGLKKRLNNYVTNKYIDRITYELNIIERMGYVDYFLIVYDIILFAKKNNIFVGPGRGSAVSSLVSYSLGITQIDPLKYNLVFERFLNPNRVSMPDIDIDVSDTKREMIINYIKEKYGNEYSALIITFSTLLPKQVLRDVAKVLDISNIKIDSVVSLLKDNDDLSDLENNYKFKEMLGYNKNFNNLLDICKHLVGLKKHVSVHAAGVVIDSNILTDKVPLYKNGENMLVSCDKDYLERLGILKIDLLSLRNLTIIDEVVESINNDGNNFKLSDIHLDDEKTFKLFSAGLTKCIFQYESNGMKNLVKKMGVNCFNDLIISVAMFRPGPIEMIPEYLKRRKDLRNVNYLVPELENILSETLGIMVYQEQLLEILKVIASYTYAEADEVRVAIKKKNEAIILKERERFINRSIKNGYKEDIAISIYNMIIKFANYGFNKSHSVAYALVGYQMGYLKANYPVHYMTNILNSEYGNKAREYIEEAKLLGLEFEKISINRSNSKYYYDSNKIVLPLTIIKGISKNAFLEILAERKKSEFKSFVDFMLRCYSNLINKSVIESLILIGAFDEFKETKQTLINNMEEIINYSLICKEIGEENIEMPKLIKYQEYSKESILANEIDLLGFYYSSHPASKYRSEYNASTKNIRDYYNKKIIAVMMIESIKEINTKNGDKMSFVKLSDEYGIIEGVIFPKHYNQLNNKLKKMLLVKICCTVEKRLSEYQLIIDKLEIIN